MLKTLCMLAALSHCPALQIAEVPGYAQVNPFLGTITISPRLRLTEAELAFVWAHELGHIVLRHSRPTESDVDAWAIRLVKKAGYDCRAAFSVLKRAAPGRLSDAKRACH